MPLPNILEFIGTNVTQAKFKVALEKLLSYLSVEGATKVELSAAVSPKADKTYVDNALSGFTNGASKFYPTLALAEADIANITVKDKVDIGEVANGGTWYKATTGATSLTKSAYDAVEQGKIYANNETELSLGVVRQTSSKTKTALDMIEVSSENTYPIVVDADDKVLLGYDAETDEMQGIGLVGGKSVAKKGLETFVGLSSVHPIVVDADDKVLLGYDAETDEMQGIGLVGGKSVAKKGLETFVGLSSVHPIVVDADDKVLLGYDEHTDRLIGSFQLDSLSYQNQKSVKFPYYLPHHALNQVISYGQSLSTGTKGQPVLSSTQNFANVTFSGGVLYWGNDATQLTTSKPLIEETLNDQGETICSGLANYASYLALTQNGVPPSDHVIFASSAGSQGFPILNLMKGSSTYTNKFLKHLTSARQINQDIALNIVTWMQGETDSGALPALYPTLTKDDYKAKFLQLVNDVNNDAKALGQETPVIFLTYQHSSLVEASDAGTQRAMIEAMQENDKVYCIVPTYPFPHADVLHLTALGYKWIGAYFGRAYKQILHDKIKPLTLKPLSSIYSGNKVTVFFDVPFSPLKFDTKTLAETKNFGFSVKVNGIQAEISSVKVAQSGTSIEILLSSSIATSSIVEVRYAIDQSGVSSTILASGSGNLCDSCPETVSINGNVRPLFYVCPHFSLIAINGDI